MHYLSWMSRAAVKQGRSSSKWKISMVVSGSSRNGRRSTNSEIRGGLFHARNCKQQAQTAAPSHTQTTPYCDQIGWGRESHFFKAKPEKSEGLVKTQGSTQASGSWLSGWQAAAY